MTPLRQRFAVRNSELFLFFGRQEAADVLVADLGKWPGETNEPALTVLLHEFEGDVHFKDELFVEDGGSERVGHDGVAATGVAFEAGLLFAAQADDERDFEAEDFIADFLVAALGVAPGRPVFGFAFAPVGPLAAHAVQGLLVQIETAFGAFPEVVAGIDDADIDGFFEQFQDFEVTLGRVGFVKGDVRETAGDGFVVLIGASVFGVHDADFAGGASESPREQEGGLGLAAAGAAPQADQGDDADAGGGFDGEGAGHSWTVWSCSASRAKMMTPQPSFSARMTPSTIM